jgi:hypothetical protein
MGPRCCQIGKSGDFSMIIFKMQWILRYLYSRASNIWANFCLWGCWLKLASISREESLLELVGETVNFGYKFSYCSGSSQWVSCLCSLVPRAFTTYICVNCCPTEHRNFKWLQRTLWPWTSGFAKWRPLGVSEYSILHFWICNVYAGERFPTYFLCHNYLIGWEPKSDTESLRTYHTQCV